MFIIAIINIIIIVIIAIEFVSLFERHFIDY